MAGRLAQVIDRWRLRKVQALWQRAADSAEGLDPFALRSLRSEARDMRRRLDRVIHVAEGRLALPALGAGLPRMPLGSDWVWRADLWRGPVPLRGAVAANGRTAISDDLALYHDCPLGEIALRQLRNSNEADRAPFGLALDVFGFRGSFLSLATTLPAQAVSGLRARHLIRLDAVIDSDRPFRAFARLNIKHGPDLAQLVSEIPAEGRERLVEFDLAYAKIDETRVERAWLDLIFNDTANNRIILRDVVLARRPRAEI